MLNESEKQFGSFKHVLVLLIMPRSKSLHLQPLFEPLRLVLLDESAGRRLRTWELCAAVISAGAYQR
jgi:hypothetical protein